MSMDCMDNVNLRNCFWFEGESEKRNFVSATISFVVGWWLIIDGMAVNPSQIHSTYHICGLAGTLSLFITIMVFNSQIQEEGFFMGFVLGLAALIAACWTFFADFVIPKSSVKPNTPNLTVGLELFFQNAFIFAASLIYKFGRVEVQ